MQKYGAALLVLRRKVKELSPNQHEDIWKGLDKDTLVPLLVGRFELSAVSVEVPLRKAFHNMLIHLNELPIPLIKAVGAFLSCLLFNIDRELPTSQLISKLLAEPVQVPASPPQSTSDRTQVIQLLNKQHAAILATLTQLSNIKINWTNLPNTYLKTALSAQTRNMLDSFLLSIDNRLQDHIFKMKSLLGAAININGGCLSTFISSGLKSRKEFESLLTSFTNEDDKHFATKKQMQDLLVDFRRIAGLSCSVQGCITC